MTSKFRIERRVVKRLLEKHTFYCFQSGPVAEDWMRFADAIVEHRDRQMAKRNLAIEQADKELAEHMAGYDMTQPLIEAVEIGGMIRNVVSYPPKT